MHVPEGWEIGRINDLLKGLESGVSVNGEDRPLLAGENGVLKVSSVSYGYFNPHAVKFIYGKELARAKVSPRKDNIIISRSNTENLVGASAYVNQDYPNLFLSDKLWQTVAKDNVQVRWLSYILSSSYVRYTLSNLATGTSGSMKNITQKEFLDLKIPIPPLAEQEKIAEILSTWDDAIEQTERLKTNAEIHKKALMQQLLTGKKRFPEFGGEWEEVRLGDVSLIDSGFAFKSQDFLNTSCDGNYVNVIRMSDLKSGVLDREDVARVSKEIIKGLDKYELKQNDFVFGMSGSLSNYAWVKQNDLPCYLNQRVGRIRAKEGVNSLFIHYLYLSDKTKYFIQSIAAGAAQLNISIKDLRNLKVYIPLDLGEQQKIASVLNTADREIELLTQKIEHLKIEKRALMQQLLTGKRRVKVDG